MSDVQLSPFASCWPFILCTSLFLSLSYWDLLLSIFVTPTLISNKNPKEKTADDGYEENTNIHTTTSASYVTFENLRWISWDHLISFFLFFIPCLGYKKTSPGVLTL